MSTPKYKKLQRQREHQKQKQQREYEALYASVKSKRKETVEFKPYVPEETYRRETPNYPSCSNVIGGMAPKKESPKYTGTLITGIATMHKSNAVPIINKEQAIEISQMRRN